MPKAMERKLEKQAMKHGYTGKRKDRYVYGTMAKIEKAEKRKKSKK